MHIINVDHIYKMANNDLKLKDFTVLEMRLIKF